ncbi:MAG: class I SAM-dependent methyltransferase [Reyranella sp.]|nr:class I SAM-dependent methyltransferase [Reyranella sp.]
MTDPWLKRWLPLVAARTGGQPVLELGCGGGRDTAALVEAGHHVVAVELLAEAVARAKMRVPSAEFHCQDIRAPFPVGDGDTGVVLASLSLNYFSWPETIVLVERIRQVLQPDGVLLCRFNSTNDHHFGASGHPPIAENYYLVDGEPKRFFDRAAVDRLFASGWSTLGIEERMIDRYDHPKAVWEVVLARND